jgi:hypothetical protein
MALDEPLFVVELRPLQQCLAQLFNGLKALYPEKLLLQGADRSLDAAIALRSPPERRTRSKSQKGNLVLKIGADVLRAVLMAQLQAGSDLGTDRSEAPAHRLAHPDVAASDPSFSRPGQHNLICEWIDGERQQHVLSVPGVAFSRRWGFGGGIDNLGSTGNTMQTHSTPRLSLVFSLHRKFLISR